MEKVVVLKRIINIILVFSYPSHGTSEFLASVLMLDLSLKNCHYKAEDAETVHPGVCILAASQIIFAKYLNANKTHVL